MYIYEKIQTSQHSTTPIVSEGTIRLDQSIDVVTHISIRNNLLE